VHGELLLTGMEPRVFFDDHYQLGFFSLGEKVLVAQLRLV
jgi:hypothetical protein